MICHIIDRMKKYDDVFLWQIHAKQSGSWVDKIGACQASYDIT